MAAKGGVIVELADVYRTIAALTKLRGTSVAVAAPGVHQPRSVSRAQSGKKARPYRRFASFSRKRVMIADLIRWHEYGTARVPGRHWIRSTLQGKRAEIDKSIEQNVRRLIASKGKLELSVIHASVGKRVVREMRKTLRERLSPGLADSTLADPDRDKRGIPLLDTGQIRDSLTTRSEGL